MNQAKIKGQLLVRFGLEQKVPTKVVLSRGRTEPHVRGLRNSGCKLRLFEAGW